MLKIDERECYEACCICRIGTRYWYEERDVALCPCCAKEFNEDEIPKKKKWVEKELRIAKSRKR